MTFLHRRLFRPLQELVNVLAVPNASENQHRQKWRRPSNPESPTPCRLPLSGRDLLLQQDGRLIHIAQSRQLRQILLATQASENVTLASLPLAAGEATVIEGRQRLDIQALTGRRAGLIA